MGLFWCLHSFLDVFFEIGVLFFGLYKNAVCRKTVEFSRDNDEKICIEWDFKSSSIKKIGPKFGPHN